ncbi:MAG: hypothetical protein AAFY65_14240 [Pseudomonadota bacterium]
MIRLVRAIALTCAVLAPVGAMAHDPLPLGRAYDPGIQWLDRPTPTRPGQWRIRMVHHGATRQAFLNTNQTYIYQRAYEMELARLSMHMSIHRAIPRARHTAFHAVTRAYPNVTLERLGRHDVLGARILNPQ